MDRDIIRECPFEGDWIGAGCDSKKHYCDWKALRHKRSELKLEKYTMEELSREIFFRGQDKVYKYGGYWLP